MWSIGGRESGIAMRSVGDAVRHAAERFEAVELAYGHGTDNAFDEATFIVLETLGLPPGGLGKHRKRKLNVQERQAIEKNIAARVETRKPASYLLNKAYIRGFPFYVDERVIVPRSFIGEILCNHMEGEVTYSFLEKREDAGAVLDLCTGSGCLAIIAAELFRDARIDAVDLSADALAVARRNVAAHGMEEVITLYEGDLFAPLAGKAYDVIISNPPYVDAAAMAELPPEYRHEPEMALGLCGADGLDIVRRILKEAPLHLNDGGGLLCEIGRGREALEEAFPRMPFLWLETENSSGEVFWITKAQLTG